MEFYFSKSANYNGGQYKKTMPFIDRFTSYLLKDKKRGIENDHKYLNFDSLGNAPRNTEKLDINQLVEKNYLNLINLYFLATKPLTLLI
jgi:hypothetical protein